MHCHLLCADDLPCTPSSSTDTHTVDQYIPSQLGMAMDLHTHQRNHASPLDARDAYRQELKRTVLHYRSLRQQRRTSHERMRAFIRAHELDARYLDMDVPTSFLTALVHAHNGDEGKFREACAEAKATLRERLELIMQDTSMPVTLDAHQGCTNAGEGAMLSQADELKRWFETLDEVDRTISLCDMWRVG